MDKAAQYLGLARKGGMLAVGEEGSGTAIAAGKGRLLMLAADASPNAQKRAAGFSVRSPRTAADAALDEGGAFRHAGQARMQHALLHRSAPRRAVRRRACRGASRLEGNSRTSRPARG